MTAKKQALPGNWFNEGNMALWDKLRTPNPKYLKQFTRGGGFKGTAINSQYTLRALTEAFGPVGLGWRVHIISEAVEEGAPIIVDKAVVGYEKVHMMMVRLDYRMEDEWVEGPIQYGQTMLVGTNKYGPFTDEEAPKKSLTDAIGKCAAVLGVSADIYLGLWDDNKYVNQAEQKYSSQPAPEPQVQKQETPKELLDQMKELMEQAAVDQADLDHGRTVYQKLVAYDTKLAKQLAQAMKEQAERQKETAK